ncbi:vWA domain-containing protein [Actinomadura harenae]|uniref:vWA domain-containing protein n=1 Tax=Actinomadura harenae TaxID=2483351 RepID=UPI0018F57D5E|nr:hypothetical protein [Actinomadura harenae]
MAHARQKLSNVLVSLCESLRAEPMVAAKLRLAVLEFSDDVQVRLAVSDMHRETSLPQLTIRGLTGYRAVFDDLLARIPAGVRWLRGEGYKVHRPVVFLHSDGQPTDGGAWRLPLARLTNRAVTPTVPNIIACGTSDAQARTMVKVATRHEFTVVAKPGIDIGRAGAE